MVEKKAALEEAVLMIDQLEYMTFEWHCLNEAASLQACSISALASSKLFSLYTHSGEIRAVSQENLDDVLESTEY
jgi:hypothetical protein